jgi:hypothetical protein
MEFSMKAPVKPALPALLAACLFVLITTGPACQAADTKIEAGPGVLSAEFSRGYGILLSEIWLGKYALSIGWFSDQKFNHRDVDENSFVMAQWLFSYKKLQLGFGAALWENTNRALGRKFTFQEQIGIRLRGNWDISYRHWSNASTAKPNSGQNLLSVGYNF